MTNSSRRDVVKIPARSTGKIVMKVTSSESSGSGYRIVGSSSQARPASGLTIQRRSR